MAPEKKAVCPNAVWVRGVLTPGQVAGIERWHLSKPCKDTGFILDEKNPWSTVSWGMGRDGDIYGRVAREE